MGILVGGFLSALTAISGFGLDLIGSFSTVMASGGGAILGDIESLWRIVETLVAMPIVVAGNLAISAGPFAPIVVAGVFTAVAAFTAGLVWALFRIVRYI